MDIEDFSGIILQLKRKLLSIIAIFGAGALFSFPFMGKVIQKIEHDMFYGLTPPDNPDAAGRLVEISHNLTSISKELASYNSVIAQNLTRISGELLSISQNLNTHRPAIVYLTPLEVIMLELKMSLIVGAIVVSPLILYYAYRGLRDRLADILPVNRSLLIITLSVSAVLFLLGASYSYFLMLPLFLKFIYQDAVSLGVNATFSIYDFIYFIVSTTVLMGFAFELPLILTLLARLGVTSRQTLVHYRKHAYVVLLIIAAWITPDPTMFSQMMLTLPFIVLFEVSLLLMKFTGKPSTSG